MPFGFKFWREADENAEILRRRRRRFGMLLEATMKIGKMLFTAMFAIGFGSSCAYAQPASTAAQPLPSSAQTTTSTTATFTAVVAQVNKAAGTISLTQTLAAKPTALHDSPTATADYQASPVLVNQTKVGAIVQATVQLTNGKSVVIALQTPTGVFLTSPTLTPDPLASNPLVSNPAR